MAFAMRSSDDLNFLEKIGALCIFIFFPGLVLVGPGVVVMIVAVGLEYFFGRNLLFWIVSVMGLILIAPSGLAAIVIAVVSFLNGAIEVIGDVAWWTYQRITRRFGRA